MARFRDLQERRPVINWGPVELEGKPCRIVVEKNYDESEERYRNRVVNVFPPQETVAVTEEAEDFDAIPY